jgi:hypothetical protein
MKMSKKVKALIIAKYGIKSYRAGLRARRQAVKLARKRKRKVESWY